MIYAVNILRENDYQNALNNGVDTFLYNQLDFELEKSAFINYVECNSNRVPSTWYLWKKNESIMNNFKLKYPDFF
jgi:hypothetical protein